MSTTTTSRVGRLVIRIDDDRAVPTVGKIVGQVDEDYVEVAWGDERFADEPRCFVVAVDELTPARVSA